jgi:hypothetical protein
MEGLGAIGLVDPGAEYSSWEHLGLDYWGNRFIYRFPGEISGRNYDLYSVGPNGVDDGGGGDDVIMSQ